MNITDVFLGCFVFGILWSLAAVLLGGLHLGGHHAEPGMVLTCTSHSSHDRTRTRRAGDRQPMLTAAGWNIS